MTIENTAPTVAEESIAPVGKRPGQRLVEHLRSAGDWITVRDLVVFTRTICSAEECQEFQQAQKRRQRGGDDPDAQLMHHVNEVLAEKKYAAHVERGNGK